MTTTFEGQDTAAPAGTLDDAATVQAATAQAALAPVAPAHAAPAHPAPVQAAPAHPAPMRPATPRRYQSRSGRTAVVAPSLADLRGPAQGTVELPLRLFWSCPGHTFDLGDLDMRLWLYQTVLREASRPEDLTTYLDGDTLIALWPDLYLPLGVRQAWEDAHPLLRATAAVV
jgi:hypothetical protein